MEESVQPRGILFSMPASLPTPSRQTAPPPVAAPEPPEQERSGRYGWLILLLGVGIGILLFVLTNKDLVQPAANTAASLRTAKVAPGKLDNSLRVGGTIAAKSFTAIRAPRMRGPGDAGRSGLILMELVEPGAMVKTGDNRKSVV
jgi:multidrug efflux pump subunit AcrA (membrane-fusion protein)